MRKSVILLLLLVLIVYPLSPSLVVAAENEPEDLIVLDESVVDEISKTTEVDLSDVDLTTYDDDFDFLLEDEVFLGMEEYLVLTEQDVSVYENNVSGQWVPIAAAAIRLLTSKVGQEGMKKGWAVARPHVQKALDAPKKYILEGAGGGGRIIQVRLKSNGSVLFRLDYFPVKTGGKNVLHYHVPPNLKTHYTIF